jgi:hypothetical protein
MADGLGYTAGSGNTVFTDDLGASGHAQRIKVILGADGNNDGDVHTLNPMPTIPMRRAKPVAAAAAMTRPANVTAYTAGDAVSNNATAASVTPISFTAADQNDAPLIVYRCRIDSTDTGVQGKSFRVYLFSSDPTASTGVGAGDNGVWSQKKAGFIGTLVGTFKTFSDGSFAICVPEDGGLIVSTPASGAKTIYALLQTVDAFTPSANSTTFTLTLEIEQARA